MLEMNKINDLHGRKKTPFSPPASMENEVNSKTKTTNFFVVFQNDKKGFRIIFYIQIEYGKYRI